jgi:alkyl-hydroperoxide reductase/thiol specific antioxidant family protein
VQKELAGLEELDVAIVSPAEPVSLERVGRELGLTVPLLSDPTWSTYRAFGFGRAGARTLLLSPRAWWAGLRAILKGRLPRRPTEDYAELGGDVLLAPDGRVAWIHRSRNAADRPPAAEVLRNLP